MLKMPSTDVPTVHSTIERVQSLGAKGTHVLVRVMHNTLWMSQAAQHGLTCRLSQFLCLTALVSSIKSKAVLDTSPPSEYPSSVC